MYYIYVRKNTNVAIPVASDGKKTVVLSRLMGGREI